MRKYTLLWMCVVAIATGSSAGPARGDTPPPVNELRASEPPMVRELFVPFDDLNVLLENQPRRVLLSREEYETLLAKAASKPPRAVPVPAAILAAEYDLVVEQERARITGTLSIEVLDRNLQTVSLDLAGVGVRRAMLDGAPAAIGQAKDGAVTLFLEGKGLHRLELELVAPLLTTAAQQALDFRVPVPAATRVRLTVPGDVEIKSGMPVMSRTFDASVPHTRFELPAAHERTSIVMTLNSHLLRTERVVVARSVIVDEVTQHYERLHATISLAVLHKAADSFRLIVPAGFEVTQVHSPLLARWSVTPDPQGGGILDIHLREQTTQTVVLNLAALRTAPPADAWTFPMLKALDVSGEVAVVGVLLEDRMQAEAVRSEGLIPIDTNVLTQALPASVFQAEPGAPPIRPVVAYYAPQADFHLAATFQKAPAQLMVTTGLLLTLTEKDQQVAGGFTLLPDTDKLFAVDFTVPDDWHVTEVTAADGGGLPFERFAGRIHVTFPQGLPPRQVAQMHFQARSVPAGWLDEWTTTSAVFPVFKVTGATRETGAVAVAVQDDLSARPESLQQLSPLDEKEKAVYGLTAGAASLAYRFDEPSYQAKLTIDRVPPRLTAQTYSAFIVRPEVLKAHYEIVYEVEQAKVRRLGLTLPASTPETLSIKGLDGVVLKEYVSQTTGDARHWSILLAEPRRERTRLAVDFEQPLSGREVKEFALPIAKADGVAHQAGLVSVEGDAELNVKVATALRKVDIGEFAAAAYQPGKRLLGVYSFVGDSPEVRVDVARVPGHDLPAVLIERAELVTVLGAAGLSQNAARVWFRSKAPYLEVKLPEGAALWSAQLDDVPAKPQREDQRLLLTLPAGSDAVLHDLQFVYEMPVRAVGWHSELTVPAPTLLLRSSDQAAAPVPVAGLTWRVYVPSGYRVTDTGGSVATDRVPPTEPAIYALGRFLYKLSGGIDPFYSGSLRLRGEYRYLHVQSSVGPTESSNAIGDEADQKSGVSYRYGIAVDQDGDGVVADQLASLAARKTQPEAMFAMTPQLAEEAAVWALQGVRSLKINLDESGEPITFHSLGDKPRVAMTLLDEHRAAALAWAIACAVALWGLWRVNAPVRSRASYVVTVATVSTLIPLVTGSTLWTQVLNPAFIVACGLVPFYLLVALVRWVARRLQPVPLPASVTTAIVLALTLGMTTKANAAEAVASSLPMVVEMTEPHPPVSVPADAIILPYDPNSGAGFKDVRQILVPYDKYVELWNRAYPDEKMTRVAPPAPYAFGGVALRATLKGDEHLLIEAEADIDVYTEGAVSVPLPLENGVLVKAELDGQPASLGVARASDSPTTQPAAAPARPQSALPKPPQPEAGLLVLSVSGPGRHHLVLAAQVRLQRSGGWRSAKGRLLAAPAGTLTLTVPDAQTEVRLDGVSDRTNYLTTNANQAIDTALNADGRIAVQWRPKVSEGVVDQSLTAQSTVLLDVQEDGLRLVWRAALEFRRSERSNFRVSLPAGYLVTRVAGGNVRGWEVRPVDTHQQLEVTLLKPARDHEQFDVHLWKRGHVGAGDLAAFEVPAVTVEDAALHHGQFVIRRSPLLDLRTGTMQGVTRTDLPAQAANDLGLSVESPLGIRPFAAYAFAAVPFSMQLSVSAVPSRITADVQTVLRIGERQRSLETRVNLDVQNRPCYYVGLLVPAELDLQQVSVPGAFEWSVAPHEGRKLVSIILTEGRSGAVPVLISGRLGKAGVVEQVTLPQLEVLDVERQEGDLVVQTDPAFTVDASELQQCEPILLSRVYDWLTPQQRELARLALHCRTAAYRGRLRLIPLPPDVRCYTVSNTRLTDRAIEETVLLDFTIRQAGIREVSFLLPENMKGARISVPQLRQKTIEPAGPDHPGRVRVRLELQDRVMGQLRVLVENDRLLTAGVLRVPLPLVETGVTDQRYALLENAGRDEVVVETQQGLTALDRQQKEWQTLTGILGGHITSAYIVDAGVTQPALAFKTKERAVVETVGARIGLALTWMSVDAAGTYRAVQAYRVDNSTEQFMEIQLPAGAQLWTVQVAGEPVKPAPAADPAKTDHLLIPLVKTAAGDLDYEVLVKYGGRLPAIGGTSEVTFPLIRTVNISADLSQVRLYLPEGYRWFDFGGTMTQVDNEAGLATGFVAYQTRRAERLSQAMRGPSSFAQVRAAENLKVLQSEVDRYAQSTETLDHDVQLQKEWEHNALVITGGANQVEELSKQLKGLKVEGDNRGRLNLYFEDQSAVRSQDAVQSGVSNFVDDFSLREAESQPAAAGEGIQQFDQRWFAESKLEKADKNVETGGRLIVGSKIRGEAPFGARLMDQQQQRSATPPPPPQVYLPSTVARRQLAEGGERKSGVSKRAGGKSKTLETLEQYQQTLAAQNAPSRGVVSSPALGRAMPESAENRFGGFGGGAGEGQAVAAAPAMPSGLTSLDVDMPQAGVLYRFTLPRGEATLTARSISTSSIGLLKRLVLAALVLVVLGLVYRFGRQVAQAALSRRRGAWVLMLVGLISLASGILPAAGVALVVAGLALKLHLSSGVEHAGAPKA